EAVEKEYFSATLISDPEWQALIELLAVSGKASEQKMIEQIASARAASGRDRVEAYQRIFCKTDLKPRDNLLTKQIAKENPEWLARLMAEQDRICKLIEREN